MLKNWSLYVGGLYVYVMGVEVFGGHRIINEREGSEAKKT